MVKRVLFIVSLLVTEITCSSMVLAQHFSLHDLNEIFEEPSDSRCYLQANLTGSLFDLKSSGSSFIPELESADIFTGSDSDFVIGTGGAIGIMHDYQTHRRRLEIEGMWQGQSSFTAAAMYGGAYPVKQNLWTSTTNLWFDKPVVNDLRVYAGGGIGIAVADVTIDSGFGPNSHSRTSFAYMVGTGVTMPLNADLECDLGYRFLDYGTNTIPIPGGSCTANSHAHQVMLSLRWYLY